jgi:hypothetical protein
MKRLKVNTSEKNLNFGGRWKRKTAVGIERIVLLDFIHRLVSQKTNKIEELKI